MNKNLLKHSRSLALHLFIRQIILMVVFLLLGATVLYMGSNTLTWIGAVLFPIGLWVFIFAEANNQGERDQTFTRTVRRRQEREPGYTLDDEDQGKIYHPAKGFIAGFLSNLLGLALALLALIPADGLATVIIPANRFWNSAYLSVFNLMDQAQMEILPWLYLAFYGCIGLSAGIGYLAGKQYSDKLDRLNQQRKKQDANAVRTPEGKLQ
ncbi:MAG: hypothetical protein ACOYJA_03345 [Christensenellales bacterium]|jgi:hypothetical protein